MPHACSSQFRWVYLSCPLINKIYFFLYSFSSFYLFVCSLIKYSSGTILRNINFNDNLKFHSTAFVSTSFLPSSIRNTSTDLNIKNYLLPLTTRVCILSFPLSFSLWIINRLTNTQEHLFEISEYCLFRLSSSRFRKYILTWIFL